MTTKLGKNGVFIINEDGSITIPGGISIPSTTEGEPVGAGIITNIVKISQTDYDAAVTAGTLVATTQYLTY